MPEISVVICRHCHEDKPIREFGGRKVTKQGYSTCNTCWNVRMRERRRLTPEPLRKTWREWRLKNKDEFNKHRKEEHRQVKLEVLQYYSGGDPHCACCSCDVIEFLSIDHINGGGNQDRQKRKRKYQTTYEYLKGEGFPLGFRVLCYNCNLAIGFYGYCPHQKAK